MISKEFKIKIADFGFCTRKTTNAYSRLGTEGYKAPEIEKEKGYTYTVDIYALGKLLTFLYSFS